jgi:hypothetical protein
LSSRLQEISIIAEVDEDVALQLESERFLTYGDTVEGLDRKFYEQASEIADSYLSPIVEKVDEKLIDQLAKEIDF